DDERDQHIDPPERQQDEQRCRHHELVGHRIEEGAERGGLVPTTGKPAIQPIRDGGKDKGKRRQGVSRGLCQYAGGQVIHCDQQRNHEDPHPSEHDRQVHRHKPYLKPGLTGFAPGKKHFVTALPFQCNARYMRSASSMDTPSTLANSSMLASATPRRPPKRTSMRWRRFGPMPSISSRRDTLRALARLARIPVMANLCASSRICATSMSAAESRP